MAILSLSTSIKLIYTLGVGGRMKPCVVWVATEASDPGGVPCDIWYRRDPNLPQFEPHVQMGHLCAHCEQVHFIKTVEVGDECPCGAKVVHITHRDPLAEMRNRDLEMEK